MFAWGFNTIGNWSDQRLATAHRVPYVVTLRGWGIESGPMGVADVYAPDFAQVVDRAAAQQCDSRKDDPYLLGYFLGNEPPWPGRETVAADAILAGPESALTEGAEGVPGRRRYARTAPGVPLPDLSEVRRGRDARPSASTIPTT